MNNKNTLVQFGAGNIGRSLVGQLFANAGWEVIFLDVVDSVVDELNKKHGYRITVKDEIISGQPGSIEVKNVSGINLKDSDKAISALAKANLVGTSVGAANLKSSCGLIAQALQKRSEPLSLLLCENLHDAAKLAEGYLKEALPASFPLKERIGLVEAAIGKMVPNTPPEVRSADPLAVWAEAYNTLYLDADGYLGTPPIVPGVAWRSRFEAYVDRKLLIHNFGHAATAFHGYLKGKTYIWECMADPEISRETVGCMMETSRGLAVRHADVFTFDENRATSDDLVRRFHNKALTDPVFRVGRDLKRKLAPADRCIGALRLLLETGIPHDFSVRSVAAGLLFRAEDENGQPLAADVEVTEMAKNQGPETVLTSLCGLDRAKDAELIEAIAREYEKLAYTAPR